MLSETPKIRVTDMDTRTGIHSHIVSHCDAKLPWPRWQSARNYCITSFESPASTLLQPAKTGVLILCMLFSIAGKTLAAANQVLTTAVQILSLTHDQSAQKIPVLVTGVVTLAPTNWDGKFFVQDAGAGVFVESTNKPGPSPGDLVQVRGFSNPGAFSHDIRSPHWRKLGTAPLPDAKPVSVERLMSGAEDGRRVDVSGVVTAASISGRSITVTLASGSRHFKALSPLPAGIVPSSLVGFSARVKGTDAAAWSQVHTNLLTICVFVLEESDFIVERPPVVASLKNVLTNANAVLSLTGDQAAEGIPVSLTGVVTAAPFGWNGSFFVQDASGGVFADNSNGAQPVPGDLVQVTGVSIPGGYAPCIELSQWTKLGTAPLPEAKRASLDRVMSGAEDGQRVEISCTLRSVSQWCDGLTRLDFASGWVEFRAFAPTSSMTNLNSLAGATVRIRGTAAALFNGLLRQIQQVVIWIPGESDLIIDHLPDTGISSRPFIPLDAIARYRRNDSPDARVRVRGIVTYQRPYTDIFLHDETGGLQVACSDTNVFAPGETVEAIGYPALKDFLPVLEDAILVRTEKPKQTVVPKKADIPDLRKGYCHSDLISLKGKLLYSSLQQLRTLNSAVDAPPENILTLQSDDCIVTVEVPGAREFAGLKSIPIGSTLEVTGLCLLKTDANRKIVAVRILLPQPGNVRIVGLSDWWTSQRLLAVLGVVLAISLVGLAVTIAILRKNAALKLSIAEKIKAQEELQKTNDLLDSRVQERAKQLKFEMSARKEAEVQIKAISAERTRIAQELHDTLLQGFTGVALKLDALKSSLPLFMTATKEQLGKILGQTDGYLVEARRSVWELRSSSLEKLGDFSKALKHVSERAVEGTDIRLEFTATGEVSKLEQAVEDNFLRICEEAVANAVKHARPTRVEVHLNQLSEELRLRISDDGCGFNPDGPNTAKDGHFGLAGIRERTKSIGGDISLNSRPGKGTDILVTVQTSG
jgi:signal transduction histidine kinase